MCLEKSMFFRYNKAALVSKTRVCSLLIIYDQQKITIINVLLVVLSKKCTHFIQNSNVCIKLSIIFRYFYCICIQQLLCQVSSVFLLTLLPYKLQHYQNRCHITDLHIRDQINIIIMIESLICIQ